MFVGTLNHLCCYSALHTAVLTVVSTALTGAVGTCCEADSCALSTTQPWGPKVMMTDPQPLLSSSRAA